MVDFHGEATSEKQGIGFFCDGRASLVVGTHTHVPTANQICPAAPPMTDAGMTGDYDSIIGMQKEEPLRRFTTGIPSARFEPAQGVRHSAVSRSRPTMRPAWPEDRAGANGRTAGAGGAGFLDLNSFGKPDEEISICLLALLVVEAADAQTLTKRPVSQDPVTQADMTARKSAINTAKSAPKGAARGSSIDFCWHHAGRIPRARKTCAGAGRVVTQDAAELPLRRVYVTVDGKETELTRLSSQQSGVRKASKTFSMLGPYREDGFYLAPAGLMMAEGYLQADFAVRRNGFNLYRLPGTPPDFIKADSNAMPASKQSPGVEGASAAGIPGF